DFGSTLDGGYNLTVNASAGTVTFGEDVGGIGTLTSLTVEASAVDVGGSITANDNIFLQARGGSGIIFAGGDITSNSGGLVSLQADALTFTTATTITGGTFEYAPYTPGTPVDLGTDAGAILPNADLTLDVSNIRIGAVTEPGGSSSTTAGDITIDAGGF